VLAPAFIPQNNNSVTSALTNFVKGLIAILP
jgi:hypothetical protein